MMDDVYRVKMAELEEMLSQISFLRDSTDPRAYAMIKEILNQIEMPYLRNGISIGKSLFRCRIHKPGEDFFCSIDDISYKKDNKKIHEFGRANEPYQSMFYCSDLAQTTFFETSAVSRNGIDANKEIVTIGKWEVQKDFNLINFIVSEYKNGAHKTNTTIQHFLQEFKNQLRTMEFDPEWLRLMTFFSEEYMDDTLHSKQYKTSAAFANFIYDFKGQDYYTDDLIEVHGIIYPSARWKSQGLNLVIKPEIIEQGALKLVDVNRFTLTRTTDTDYEETECVKMRNIDHSTGKIEWNI
jgi:hypothetical protein